MISRFNRAVSSIVRVVTWLSAGALMLMVLLTTVNIIFRIIYRPILGAPEIVTYSLVVVVCFGLAAAGLREGNVSVDLLVSRFPKRAQVAISAVITLLSMCVLLVIAWQTAIYGWEKYLKGEYEPVLNFSIPPFRFLAAIGFIILCLVLVIDLIRSLGKVLRK